MQTICMCTHTYPEINLTPIQFLTKHSSLFRLHKHWSEERWQSKITVSLPVPFLMTCLVSMCWTKCYTSCPENLTIIKNHFTRHCQMTQWTSQKHRNASWWWVLEVTDSSWDTLLVVTIKNRQNHGWLVNVAIHQGENNSLNLTI